MLTLEDIHAALPKINDGLAKYQWLQNYAHRTPGFHAEREFQRRFNHFYRVRRGTAWQQHFYGVMAQAQSGQWSFAQVLQALHQATGRYEASFASKLIATLDPHQPIIDAVVLKNLGLRLPAASTTGRGAAITAVHQQLSQHFADYLRTDAAAQLLTAFDHYFPDNGLTALKKVDLVLWQTRA